MKNLPYTRTATTKEKNKYKHYLSPEEKMLYITSLSKIYLFQKLIWTFVFPGILIIITAVAVGYFSDLNILVGLLTGYLLAFIVAAVYTYTLAKGTQYILTDRRLLKQKGYFNISLTAAIYDKITHVEVRQTFLQRTLLHYGVINIHTAGSQNKEIVLENIAYPLQFKNLLERLIDRYQNNKEPQWKKKERQTKSNYLKKLLN